MRLFSRTLCFLLAATLYGAPDRLAYIRTSLQQLAIDKSETWRVRELEVSLGGAKLYLSEGVLAFATPVEGHRIAAIFTTESVEGGDAEVIALPPISAERASLASFTRSPNLDEHFTSALLFFTDDTSQILLKQIHEHPLHPAPDLAPELAVRYDDALRMSAAEIDVRITQSILDHHSPANGFFYGMLVGRTLGAFDVISQPDQADSILFGQVTAAPQRETRFRMWAAFRATASPPPPLIYHLSDYHVDTTIHPDLSMSSVADFDYQADSDDGAVISLLLSPRLKVTAATIDGNPASVLMHASPRAADLRGAVTFLLIAAAQLTPGGHHRVRVKYEGSVIRRTANGEYFVDDRNLWYPFMQPMLTKFDLTFRFPANLRLVATGVPVSEEIVDGQRVVHRVTARVQALAGFNLGEYTITTSSSPPYQIEFCSNPQIASVADLATQTSQILNYFTARWMPLSAHSLAVTPIEGYFGQGFPGLIYLSNISYMPERDRPRGLRNPQLDSFFSQLLLPHELAHQWWGNMVTPSDYRSNWIVEAMANYSALEYLEQAQGRPVLDAILAGYRTDLVTPVDKGELVDSYGPVTFDQRLLSNFGEKVWHDILYEKGTWIFHMLRQRMGAEGFHQFQLRVLKNFSLKPITVDELRQEAANFIPANQPDRQLTGFFDTWVYNTGIPTLTVKAGQLKMAGVPDTYTVDVPLKCGSSVVTWHRATTGDSTLPSISCTLPPLTDYLFGQ